MTSTTRYPQELRERAVRLVLQQGGEYPSEWAAIGSISAKLGMTRETLRRWVRRRVLPRNDYAKAQGGGADPLVGADRAAATRVWRAVRTGLAVGGDVKDGTWPRGRLGELG